MSLIRGAIEEGFSHARNALSGFANLSESVGAAIDRTYELTQTYLSEFRSTQLAASQPEGPVEHNETGVEL